MVPPPALGTLEPFKRTPPEESSRLLKPLLREAEVLPEVVEPSWRLSVDITIWAWATSCTHVDVTELVGDESSSAIIAGSVTSVVVVTVESIVLLALRARPAQLRIDSD